MNDNGPADYLIHRKAAGQKQGERKPVVAEQWRQVSGMVRMFAAVWVIVGHGVCEGVVHIAAAVGSLVDMKPEYPFMTGRIRVRKSADLSQDDHTFPGLVKPYRARQAGTAFTA